MAKSKAKSKAGQSAAPETQYLVNIIFRGMFLFHESATGINVYIPDMGNLHVNRAGNFLREFELLSTKDLAALNLDPIYSFKPALPPGAYKFRKQDWVWRIYRPAIYALSKAYACITLPTPMNVIALRPTCQPLAVSSDPSGLLKGPAGITFPTVYVFQYELPDEDCLKAIDLTQYPLGLCTHTIDVNPDNVYKNIHVISEHERVFADEQMIGFRQTFSLIDGQAQYVDQIQFNLPKPVSAALPSALPNGVAAFETWNLTELFGAAVEAVRSWRNNGAVQAANNPPKVDCGPSGHDYIPYDCFPLTISELQEP